MRNKILFFAEGVTFSHVLRPLQIAESLSEEAYEIHFAITEIPDVLRERLLKFKVHKIDGGISSKEFLDSISKGTQPYKLSVLNNYFEEDCKIIKKINPVLVIGDMRLSLYVSSKKCNVPYINISNSTWDSSADLPALVPEITLVKKVGPRIIQMAYRLIKPIMMYWLAIPFNRLAMQHGVKKYGSYYDVLTSGDHTIYCDLESLVKIKNMKKSKSTIGAFLYSMESKETEKFELPKKKKKRVLLCLGSSGSSHLLEKIIESLSKLNIEIVIATLEKKINMQANKDMFIFDYLPMKAAMKEVDLLIFNGGSGSGYLGLINSTPLLCIPSNIDQHQFSYAMKKKGVAKVMRSDQLDLKKLKNIVLKMIDDDKIKVNTEKVAEEIRLQNPKEEIKNLVLNFVRGQKVGEKTSFMNSI